MPVFVAILDACVLYPASLRDTLLRGAEGDLHSLRWSDRILEETRRNLVGDGRATEQQANRLVSVVKGNFPESDVTGFDMLEHEITNHPKDRHVLAAAVVANARTIVTFSTKDFPESALTRYGITASTPDQVLTKLIVSAPKTMLEIMAEHAAALTSPPATLVELLQRLKKIAPFAAGLLQQRVDTAHGSLADLEA